MVNFTRELYMRSNIYNYFSPWNKKIEVISVDLDEEI